ncbi:vam6/Vps39-like protein [Oppia nitens]|uniref:vam6/Vps39-like protein n=1 Tax=Oppia nitens TaxID=1686743 RepID=UPI0023D9E32E|nr:vam6/Vps39-like protein [Oppia nitens]
MLDIYKDVTIMKNLPLTIESICAYDDYIIVGTKQGHLLMYKFEIRRNSLNEIKPEIHLLRSNKAFAKKPIVQIEAVPDLRILVSLSDTVISVHNLDQMTFPLMTCVSKSKGSSLFVLDVQRQRTLTGENQCTLRMCSVNRYHLQLYYWKNQEFHELSADLKVPDIPKSIAWSGGQSLCVGFRSEYSLIKISNGEHKELFPTGEKPEPSVILLDNNRLALGRDQKTYIMNSEGSPILNYPLQWSDSPICLVNDQPYLVAILPNNIVELLTIEPKLQIQRMDLSGKISSRIKLLVKCIHRSGHILLASGSDVLCLVQSSHEQQIIQLMGEHHFELALQVADMWTDSNNGSGSNQLAPSSAVNNKEQMMQRIKNMHAFDLFCKKQFKEALSLFLKLETDPPQVIGLFPDLLPEDYRNKLDYPSKPPQLLGTDLETGLFCLIDYLLEVRRNLANNSNSGVHYNTVVVGVGDDNTNTSSSSSETTGSPSLKAKYQLKSIIDTTLLKCYLQTNEALVAPLLRLPDNHCHLEEVEKALKRYHKYNELIILYQNKGLHRNALDLLFKQSKKPDSPLAGFKRTVQYLQHLTAEHLDLIFEYSEWVLKQYPEEGIKIFTDDAVVDMELLPRQEVVQYLQKVDDNLLVPYLEHLIFQWMDTTPGFHNALIHKYRERVRILLADYKNNLMDKQSMESTSDGTSISSTTPAAMVGAGEEPGELGELRRKLLKFLEDSDHYSTETLPTYLLNDGLFEERAVVMGKIGNHKEALVIYVHVLHDTRRAEQYCQRQYDKGLPENKNVFLTLLDLYLSIPPRLQSGKDLDTGSTVMATTINPALTNLEANVQSAIQLLTRHSTKIDPLRVIKLLPPDIPVVAVEEFLHLTTDHLLRARHSGQIFRNLLLAKRLQVHKQRIRLEQLSKLVVDEVDLCQVCHKRIGKSVFVRFTNRDLVHLMCKEKYNNNYNL